MVSKCTVRDIKFDSTTTTKFLDWLSKEQIFIESDSLGISKTATVEYLFKLHPHLTNRTFLKPLLVETLCDIVLPLELACKLDPTVETQQAEAKVNGDLFVPKPPPFKVYKTHVSYGRDDKLIKTDIIGIKCTINKSHLLKEFFTQLGNQMELDTHISTFVPTSTVHLIGLDTYAKLLQDHNSFLQTVVTVPIGDFQHVTLNILYVTDSSMDIDTTTLYDAIPNQPRCLSLKRTTTTNKVLLIMTKGQLAEACTWVDRQLSSLYEQNISDKLDVTLQSLIPHWLDKPFLTSASTNYAAQLKQRSSIITAIPTKQNLLNRPPRTHNTKLPTITYAEAVSQQTKNSPTTPAAMATLASATASTPAFDYQSTFQRISQDIETTLKVKFDAAIANLQKLIDNINQKVKQKLRTHMATIKALQADKATQDNHTQQLGKLTKTLDMLVLKLHSLLDNRLYPTPMNGVGPA